MKDQQLPKQFRTDKITLQIENRKPQVFPRYITVAQALQNLLPDSKQKKILAAFVNNLAYSLSHKIEISAEIIPIELNSREGVNIYRRSLCFLLAMAAQKIFPQRRLIIGHSLGKGYYYEFENWEEISLEELERLSQAMGEIVKADYKIETDKLSYQEALDYFRQLGEKDTVRLIEYRTEPEILISVCKSFIDIFHGPLVPSTGFLQTFELYKYKSGFILRYPPIETPEELMPFEDNPLLFSIYREHKRWGKILNINCIGLLNEKISSGKIKDFIETAEALHEKKIAEIADQICKHKTEKTLILIAGPSSSGKTTFAKRLAIQLKVLGYLPVQISLDDYYLPRGQTPRDEEGNYDFESLEALNLERLNNDLIQLLEKGEALIPQFDFVSGEPKTEKKITLQDNSLLIIEGIHGLNDQLTSKVKAKHKFKIYVSALTQLNLDDHNRIPTTDIRLLRRMIRDYQFRGYSALNTLKMWPSVRRGEDKYIFPFQNNADAAFNSSLDYELAVLKVYAEPLLKTIKPSGLEYSEAQRLLSFLNNVVPLPANWVPPPSILREFIGESGFKY